MELFRILLAGATLTCGLAAGLLFAFAVVVMPGLSSLTDHDFLKSFRAIDRIIQRGQPLFMIVFVGSVVLLVAATVAGAWLLALPDLWLLVAATIIYLLGVVGPTAAINVPLNNRVQAFDLGSMDARALEAARQAFEPRWNRWNVARTALSILATALLIVLLLRI